MKRNFCFKAMIPQFYQNWVFLKVQYVKFRILDP